MHLCEFYERIVTSLYLIAYNILCITRMLDAVFNSGLIVWVTYCGGHMGLWVKQSLVCKYTLI